MANDTKKRLLISKWRGTFKRGVIENRVGQLLAGVDRLNDLVGKLAEQDEKIATLEDELQHEKDNVKSLEDERDERADQLEQALESVKYWLHDGIVHGKLVSDPRRLLRNVEDALQ